MFSPTNATGSMLMVKRRYAKVEMVVSEKWMVMELVMEFAMESGKWKTENKRNETRYTDK